MINLKINNDRSFNSNIYEVLKESPQLLNLDKASFDFISEKIKTNEEIKIINDDSCSHKENYDIFDGNMYIGNIFLSHDDIIDFWQICIIIFPLYRGKGHAQTALKQLLNLYPDRNWELTILDKHKNFKSFQEHLINLGFEKTKYGWANSQDEFPINYKKASTKVITVIASSYFTPISDLLNNLLNRSKGGINELQTSSVENGYSVSLCILLVACFESYIRRDYYFKKETSRIHILNFISTNYSQFPYLQEITECFIVRDLLLHNHIWEIEHTYSELKVNDSEITAFSGDAKFKENIDYDKRETKKLKLNINPIRINRKDVKIVLQIIWKSLLFLSESKDSEIVLDALPVIFDNKVTNIKDVYELFIKTV
jgi:hypothetical protein